MTDNAIANPFTTEQSREVKQTTASADVAVQRELGEVQGAILMARRFPRDPMQVGDAILRACTRPTLAETALYEYARGGTAITGPSIRLAEAMAQIWGNLTFGIRELEQRAGESTMEAYCWDMETNVRQSRIFQVRHERHTRGGTYKLTDPRDVYEIIANAGSRRLRACILGVIPGDITEAATKQCEETMKAEADVSSEAVKKLTDAFASLGVTQKQIEVRIQRHLESIRPAQVAQLRRIWSSLNDGMSQISDWFEAAVPLQEQQPATGNVALRQRLRPQRQQPAPASPLPETESAGTPSAEPAADPLAAGEPPGEARPSPGGTLSDIPEIKPVQARGGRGWNWTDYADRYMAAALELPVSELSRFRERNAKMFDVLRRSDQDEWARCNEALANYEREGSAA